MVYSNPLIIIKETAVYLLIFKGLSMYENSNKEKNGKSIRMIIFPNRSQVSVMTGKMQIQMTSNCHSICLTLLSE